MLVTEGCVSGQDVLSDVVGTIIADCDKVSDLDMVVGNFRLVHQDCINKVMEHEIDVPSWISDCMWKTYMTDQLAGKGMLSFDSEFLSELIGGQLSAGMIDIIKDFNPERLATTILSAGGTVKRLVEMYVERDGYGDHFSCDGEATLVDGIYIFKLIPLDDCVVV